MRKEFSKLIFEFRLDLILGAKSLGKEWWMPHILQVCSSLFRQQVLESPLPIVSKCCSSQKLKLAHLLLSTYHAVLFWLLIIFTENLIRITLRDLRMNMTSSSSDVVTIRLIDNEYFALLMTSIRVITYHVNKSFFFALGYNYL